MIGLPVTATDPNGDTDTLTYTLGGSDKGSFDIGSTDGQITVKAGTTLNYESKKVYKVTVTATDPSPGRRDHRHNHQRHRRGRGPGDSRG